MTPTDIKADLDQVEADGTFLRQRQDINSRVRYARWDGQTEDGKKHEAYIGSEPFPFEGASDTRVRMAETIINEEVRICKNAFKRSKLKVKGTEVSDWGQASKSTTALDWMINTQMSPNAQKEAGLCAEWRQEKGSYLMRIDWHQEAGLEQDDITLMEIQEAATEIPEARQLLGLIADGGLDEEAAQLLAQFNDQLTEKTALNAVKDLREDGIATYDVPYFRINRPRWTALRVYRDVFFPTYTDDIQRTPWIAERQYYTEAEIKEKELTAGWKKSFVKKVLEHKGDRSLSTWDSQERNKFGRTSYEETIDDMEDLYEIYHVYYKENDPKTKAIGIYTYDMSYFVEDDQSQKETLLDYDHGLYPFVAGLREHTERGIVQSRGWGEILQTPQKEVKTQRDNAADRTALDTIPPMLVPASRGALKLTLGAGTQIPYRRPGEIEPLVLPNNTQNTELVIGQVMREIDRYTGQDLNDPASAMLYKQCLIDAFLGEMQQVYEQTFALMQQFMPDVETFTVTGGTLESLNVTRQQIQGKYDLAIQFDARDLDGDALKEKAAFWKELMAMDSDGTISNSSFIAALAQSFDPMLAEEIISSPQQVQARELTDEQDALGKIGGGVEPPLNPQGANAQMRLQIIQQTVQTNPNNMQRYQEDEIYRGMIDARVAMFQQSIAQQENAQIGRVGAERHLDSLEGEQPFLGGQPPEQA